MTTPQVPERFTREYVADLFERGRRNDATLERAWDRLLAEHEGEWVAIDADNMVMGPTLDTVTCDARSRGFDMRVTVTAHVVKNPPAVLL
ncbi:MAG TPA: hypothetical protein VJP07_04845 [Dehalococcoidia bacterium]|nr:hypothetical protein [Dehalococcoidia bacterium]